jgi:hypothetical protein
MLLPCLHHHIDCVITVTLFILLEYFPTETVQPSINQSDPKENDLTPA